MTGVDRWNGARATHLQEALRLTIEDFAERLAVSSRTVAAWHHEGSRIPRAHAQRVLDSLLADAHPAERSRFEALSSDESPDGPSQPGLHAALALVVKPGSVLLVRRREARPIAWQFPAGIVKPEATAEDVAVNETLAETGVDCAVRRTVGARTHPKTGVYCVYLLCDYLAGEPDNRDPIENASVRWVPVDDLSSFIPESLIYPPALEAITEGAS